MKCFNTVFIASIAAAVYTLPGTYPVCIIGAGPAGLAAAASLELKGLKTVIFEKQAHVGGKCQAVYRNGTFNPLGALIYTYPTYRETGKIVNASDVAPVEFTSGQQWQYNWTTGVPAKVPPAPTAFTELLSAEIARYISWWKANFYPFNVTPGYRNGIPGNLSISVADWLAKNQYQALPIVFIETMVAYGYGDYRQVPVIYMLQYLTPDVLLTLLRVQQGESISIIDFHKVFTRYARRRIKGPIHLSSLISNIDRSGPHPVISYQRADQGKSAAYTQQCSSLILAFPPTISALQAANLKLSEEERTVFSAVGINAFWSGAVRMQIPHGMTFSAASASPYLPPDAAGEPVVFVKLQNSSEIATTSSWGAYRGNTTTEEAYNLLKTTLSKLNRDPRSKTTQSKPIRDADVLAFQHNDYFPHFDSAQLAAGYFQKFDALQGTKQTYWASGMNMFELVEYAVRAGQDVVERYF